VLRGHAAQLRRGGVDPATRAAARGLIRPARAGSRTRHRHRPSLPLAAAGPFALGTAAGAPGFGVQPVERGNEPGAVVAHVAGALLPAVQGAPAGRARALTVYTDVPVGCSYGGMVTTTIDDVDDNGVFGVGDRLEFAFDQCRLTPSEITHARVAATLVRVDDGPLPALTARLAMTGLSSTSADGLHSVATDCTALLDYAQLDAWRERLRLTVEGTATVHLRTHAGIVDTIGLQPGYFSESVHDFAIGRSSTTGAGQLHSAAAAGLVRVETAPALDQGDRVAFPDLGGLRVQGARGTLMLRALPGAQVQLELDVDDCGTAEHVRVESWDWLL
jgi:hypothetical protein